MSEATKTILLQAVVWFILIVNLLANVLACVFVVRIFRHLAGSDVAGVLEVVKKFAQSGAGHEERAHAAESKAVNAVKEGVKVAAAEIAATIASQQSGETAPAKWGGQ